MPRERVGAEGAVRIGMGAEAFELRVIPVSLCGAAEHLLREKRFSPQGDESFRVQVARVEGPETHEGLPSPREWQNPRQQRGPFHLNASGRNCG